MSAPTAQALSRSRLETPDTHSPQSSTSATGTASAASSMTATEAGRDVEAGSANRNPSSHLGLVFNPAGVSRAVIDHKYPGDGTEESPYIVDFLEDDAHNPFSFPMWKKWSITLGVAFATLAVAFVSTAYTGGVEEVIKAFDTSTEVAILGVSLFVLGFAIGPLLWAPLSEFFGRQVLFFGTYMALTAFNAGAAGAQNIQTLIILRFFAGAFGSSPLTNSGGVIADMFSQEHRGRATALFAAAPFLGPSIGPIVGGFLGQAEGFRWVEGVMAIFTGVLWILCSLLIPETYAPVLLRKRAQKLSKLTGKHYVSKMDANNKKKMTTQFKVALSRPWVLLLREPIVFLTAIYMAIIYGTLYLCFAAFPIVFQEYRGWSEGVGGLSFLGVAVGMMLGVGYAIWDNQRYMGVVKKHGGMAPPEARLPPGIIGSILLPVGLFWFAWTNGPEIHWIVPIIATGFFAAGLVLVFLSLFNYLIDSYVIYAASVLAANSVIRSLFGAVFPLFTTQMYQNLGIHWASAIPAFLALACAPFPWLFYKYGEPIRLRCKYAAEAAKVLEVMRGQARRNESGEQEEEDEEEIERQRSSAIPNSQEKEKADGNHNGHVNGHPPSRADEKTVTGEKPASHEDTLAKDEA